MSDALKKAIPDIRERSILIIAQFVPPKTIQREANLNAGQLASELESATDHLADASELDKSNDVTE